MLQCFGTSSGNTRRAGDSLTADGSLNEIERSRIHTIAQAGGSGAVVEDVAEVRIAFGALHFRAGHAVAVVGQILYILRRNGLVKAGPASSRLKLCLGGEQRILTT